MFVQVIEGKTSNPEGLRAQFDKWVAKQPTAGAGGASFE